eukprot:gene16909-8396_t
MMGMPGLKSAQVFVDELKLPITPEEFLQETKKHKKELFPTCNILPGAEKLVKHLLKCKIPIALASGSFTTDFETKTQNHRDFFSLFEIKTLGDDPEVTHGKPNPEVFLVTARKFKDTPEPGSVLVFEDAPNGVIAAKSAGMAVVMVPDERMDSSMYNNADLVLGSLENYKPEDWGFPAFEEA